MQQDMYLLAKIGVDIKEILPIVAVMDTWLIGQVVLGLDKGQGQKLVDLLTCLGCPSGKMHNAGNDAMFTMRALLALSLQSQWNGPREKVSLLKRIAYAPVRVTDILNEKRERSIASQRALGRRDRKDQKHEDWVDVLDQLNIDAD